MRIVKHAPTGHSPGSRTGLRRAAGIGVAAALAIGGVVAAPAHADRVHADTDAPAAGGYWTTSYEQGEPRPAGFPAASKARNIRGERALAADDVTGVWSEHANGGGDEPVTHLADGDPATKWYASGSGAPSDARPLTAVYTLAEPTKVTAYSLTAGDDSGKFPERDPRSWTVLGSNDPRAVKDADHRSWREVGSQADEELGASGLTRFYDAEQPGRYRYYQLRITANAGGADARATTQLADWTLRTDAGTKTSALGASVEQAGEVEGADGDQALRFAGRVGAMGPASSSIVLQSGLDVVVGSDTDLTYRVHPDDAAAGHVVVDVVSTAPDGTDARRLWAAPTEEPRADGWTEATLDLSEIAGRHVERVLLDYTDDRAARGPVEGWVDGLEIGAPLLGPDAEWTYLDEPDVDPADGADDRTAWTLPGAEPGDGWKTAGGPFGVKDGGTDLGEGFPVTTQLNQYKDGTGAPNLEAYFFRTTFTVDEAALDALGELTGHLRYDDTATVYLNGERVAGWGDDEITENLQYQNPDGGGGIGDPATGTFTVDPDDLVAGENTLAVEVHQANDTSSDAYFGWSGLAAGWGAGGFTDEELGREYPSDTLPTAPGGQDFFTWVLRSFDDARQEPAIMGPNEPYPLGTEPDELTGANDRAVVDINNSAEGRDDPQVAKALLDAHDSPSATMADGLGSVVGDLYAQALAGGELPRTEALLGWRVEKPTPSSGDWYQEAKNAYAYGRPFVRVGFAADGGLLRMWDSAGAYRGLEGDGSFPSGHTSHGYAQGIVLATLLPELAPQVLARASEYGDNRILLSYHYPTDVMGGRIVGETTATLRWSDPEFRELMDEAGAELRTVLARKCWEVGAGDTLDECVAGQDPYLPTEQALSVYRDRLTYGFDPVAETDGAPSVPEGAENLLLTSFPELDDAQRRAVLAATQLRSGYVLDQSDGTGSWQRLDLAAAMDATVRVLPDGALRVNGTRVDPQEVPAAAR